MVIHNVKAAELKGKQQHAIVIFSSHHWYELNNGIYPYYYDIMNMKTCRWNDEHQYHIALSYHFNPKKW